MGKTTLVVLSAGNSSRFTLQAKKQWLRIDDEPLWLYVTKRIATFHTFDKIIVAAHKNELSYMENYNDDFYFVSGGSTRQESIKNALQKVTTPYVMITDVARCCVPKTIIENLISNKTKASCIVPILDIPDTVIYDNETINRQEVKLVQTPQLSNTTILKVALNTSIEFTDESSAIKNINESIYYIEGSHQATKLTFGKELEKINCLKAPSKDFFVGSGIDIHQFQKNKPMVLGGIPIDSQFGFKAHSDGDVAIHSIIDALLGAIGAGDIGEFFPDNDPKYKGANSKELLKEIVTFIYNVGYEIVNIDITILAEKPKINQYKNLIRTQLASIIGIDKQKINIKATRGEKMGFIGRAEGIAVLSSANVKYYNWVKK